MNKNILNYLNKCEGWKVAIKELHWDSDNMSQHELCDDIADSISDFEDLVSEVEQSMSGKLKVNSLNPTEYKVDSLKGFVEDIISASKDFLKELEGMGENYIGIKSECETFIGDMQRKLYLVNFTLKEELKNRLKSKINESMPKNLARHDEVDKFMGRKPKSIKARINQIYKIVKKYGIDSKVYHDENWQAISDYYRAISSLGCDVDMKPCASIDNADSMMSDGGYCDYDEYDHMPRSKQYAVKITFEDGMVVSGYIKCMAAGTVQDPFASYDTCIVLWPKSNRMIENKEKNMKGQIKLTEAELKQVVKEAAMKLINEIGDTPKGRRALARLSGRRMAQGATLGAELKNNGIEGGDDMVTNNFNRSLNAGRYAEDALDREIRKALDKFALGEEDEEKIKSIIKNSENKRMQDTYQDEFYGYGENKYSTNESKESKIEIKPSKKGTFTAAATKHGKSVQGFANQVLKNKDDYSPKMVKKANFAKNFGEKK